MKNLMHFHDHIPQHHGYEDETTSPTGTVEEVAETGVSDVTTTV